MRVLKTFLFNVLGAIAGITAGWIAFLVSKLILIDLLGNFKLLTSILCWPVDYYTYAFSGMITAVAGASLYVCVALCRIGKGRLNYSCILVGLYEIIVFISPIIDDISEYGFSFDALWMILVTLGTFGIFSISFAKGEEL